MATYDLTSSIPTKIATGDILNCPYSGTSKTVTLPKGKYKLEVWGAQGGSSNSSYPGGKGGYSVGVITLSNVKTVFIYAGGVGNTNITSTSSYTGGGFNGGGGVKTIDSGQGGGGASDIRIESDSLYARVIVAGGGGGGHTWSGNYGVGGYAGGLVGGDGTTSNTNYTKGCGGTQTSGGVATSNGGSYQPTSGTFGQGGGGGGWSNYGSGGGGGWYGGGGGGLASGGGGSGYVYTSSTASNYPSGCLLDSSMYLSDASTIAGNTSIPSTSGSTETGHSGNGYVRITVISVGASGGWVEKESYTFSYTGSVQTETLPKGLYKIECWGAQGGTYSSYVGGKGGYSIGKLTLTTSTQVYIYVGGQGSSSSTAAGFNGGGTGVVNGRGGGGGSDVRIGSTSLYARVIVAGGGGGAGIASASVNPAGCGGGTYGGDGYYNNTTGSYVTGSSRSGGSGGPTQGGISWQSMSSTQGTFGQGGNAYQYSCGGGGGGWYGGGGAYDNDSDGDGRWGGGGSGYVYTESTASNYPSGCLLNSSYYLTEAETKAGNVSFPSTSGGTETGHEGNGYIKITRFVYKSALPFRMKVNNEIIEPTAGFVKVNGEWKSLTGAYAKNNGEWLGI